MHYQNHYYANQKCLIAITSVIYLSNEFLFYIGDSVDIDDVELVIIGSVYLVGDILNYIISRDNLNFWEELRVHR